MKKLLLFIMCIVVQIASATIADPRPFSGKMADGSAVTLHLVGDENGHYYATTDGTPMVLNALGFWEPSKYTASELQEARRQRVIARNQHRHAILKKNGAKNREVRAKSNVAVQKRKGLVILVNFADLSFTFDNITQTYNQIFNSKDNPYSYNEGSVREYFLDQSYGQLDIEFDIVGPVTVSHEMAYYGGNNENFEDSAVYRMVIEACQLVDEHVNFKDYDWDNDGIVDQVYFIYAGMGESFPGADPNTIWPHEWSLWGSAGEVLNLDDVIINTYACSNEIFGSPLFVDKDHYRLEGIGTACHEFSHCLGYPDMYDTKGDNYYGMGDWSIMASGSNRYNGFSPPPFTAYERWVGGWLTPVELTSPQIITSMPALTDEPVAYVIYNDANRDEYYLIANHQNKNRWEKLSESHGLLIMHVTYDETAWIYNTVNATEIQRITYFPADNNMSPYEMTEDLWDGVNGGVTELTDESTPAATLYTPNSQGKYFMSKPITCITETDGLISFAFQKADAVEVPTGLSVEAAAKDSAVVVSWSAVPGATKYKMRYQGCDPDYEFPPEFETYESFTYFEYAPMNVDLADDLDEYTIYWDWTGKNVFSSGSDHIIVGTETEPGVFTTPTISAPENGEVTLFIMASSFNENENEVTIELKDSEGTQTQVIQNLKDISIHENQTVYFEGVKSDYTLSIRGKNRVILREVIVYNLKTTLEEITKFPYIYQKGYFTGDENLGPVMTISDITEPTTTIEGLNARWSYTFEVCAYDADNLFSAWSEPVTFVVPATASGIRTIESDSLDFRNKPIYDLMGRRMPNSWESLSKGIYIIDGKKVVKK